MIRFESVSVAFNGVRALDRVSLRVEAGAQARLLEIGRRFTGEPVFTRLAQWGGHVLVRAADAGTGFAVDCWLEGIATPVVTGCSETGE